MGGQRPAWHWERRAYLAWSQSSVARVGAQQDGMVCSTLSVQQALPCRRARLLGFCPFSPPSGLCYPSIPNRTGPLLPLDGAEDPLRSCPAAFSESSEKLPNQTRITSGQAEASGLHLRHTGTRRCLETQTRALPPQDLADLNAATGHQGRSSLGGDDLLKSQMRREAESPLLSISLPLNRMPFSLGNSAWRKIRCGSYCPSTHLQLLCPPKTPRTGMNGFPMLCDGHPLCKALWLCPPGLLTC